MSARPPLRPGPPWFLITGLLIGGLIGLGFAWYYKPVQYLNAAPIYLDAGDKDQYRALIALAFDANGDRGRAEARLRLLGDANVIEALSAQAQRYTGGNGPQDEASAMAGLAGALEQPTPLPVLASSATTVPATAQPTQTTEMARATFTPLPTYTVAPTLTPSPTAGPPFQLAGRSAVCDPKLSPGLLQVVVENAAQQGVPGVQILVSWQDQSSIFYTGLAADPGYADFVMSPGMSYTILVGQGGTPVSGLQAEECTTSSGKKILGGIKLRFRQ